MDTSRDTSSRALMHVARTGVCAAVAAMVMLSASQHTSIVLAAASSSSRLAVAPHGWAATRIGSTAFDYTLSLAQSRDGSTTAAVGTFFSTLYVPSTPGAAQGDAVAVSNGDQDVFVCVLDPKDGSVRWTAAFGGPSADFVDGVAVLDGVDDDGDVVVVGTFTGVVYFHGATGAAGSVGDRWAASGPPTSWCGASGYCEGAFAAAFHRHTGALHWLTTATGETHVFGAGLAVSGGQIVMTLASSAARVTVMPADTEEQVPVEDLSSLEVSTAFDSLIISLEPSNGHLLPERSRPVADTTGAADVFVRSLEAFPGSGYSGAGVVVVGFFAELRKWISGAKFPTDFSDPGAGVVTLTSNGAPTISSWDVVVVRLENPLGINPATGVQYAGPRIKWIQQIGGANVDIISGNGCVTTLGVGGVGDVAPGRRRRTVVAGDFDSATLTVGRPASVTYLLPTNRGSADAFVAAFDVDTGEPLWAVGFGGEGLDMPMAIAAVDDAHSDTKSSVWVAGTSESAHMSFDGDLAPLATGANSVSRAGFLVQLSASSGLPKFAVRLGMASGDDQVTGVAITDSAFVLSGVMSSSQLELGPAVVLPTHVAASTVNAQFSAVASEAVDDVSTAVLSAPNGRGSADVVVMRLDCVVMPWSEWGECSEVCAGGERVRNRRTVLPHGVVMDGGADGAPVCDSTPLQQKEACNAHACTPCEGVAGVVNASSGEGVAALLYSCHDVHTGAAVAVNDTTDAGTVCTFTCDGSLVPLVPELRCGGAVGAWHEPGSSSDGSVRTPDVGCRVATPRLTASSGVDPMQIGIAVADADAGGVSVDAIVFGVVGAGVAEASVRTVLPGCEPAIAGGTATVSTDVDVVTPSGVGTTRVTTHVVLAEDFVWSPDEDPALLVTPNVTLHRHSTVVARACASGAADSAELAASVTVLAAPPVFVTRGLNPLVVEASYAAAAAPGAGNSVVTDDGAAADDDVTITLAWDTSEPLCDHDSRVQDAALAGGLPIAGAVSVSHGAAVSVVVHPAATASRGGRTLTAIACGTHVSPGAVAELKVPFVAYTAADQAYPQEQAMAEMKLLLQYDALQEAGVVAFQGALAADIGVMAIVDPARLHIVNVAVADDGWAVALGIVLDALPDAVDGAASDLAAARAAGAAAVVEGDGRSASGILRQLGDVLDSSATDAQTALALAGTSYLRLADATSFVTGLPRGCLGGSQRLSCAEITRDSAGGSGGDSGNAGDTSGGGGTAGQEALLVTDGAGGNSDADDSSFWVGAAVGVLCGFAAVGAAYWLRKRLCGHSAVAGDSDAGARRGAAYRVDGHQHLHHVHHPRERAPAGGADSAAGAAAALAFPPPRESVAINVLAAADASGKGSGGKSKAGTAKPSRRSSETSDDASRLCVACMDNAREVLLVPCRHLCLCQACAGHESIEKCPLCREPVFEKVLVYK